MDSKTTLIVWAGISLGTVVACSVSACGLPSECQFPLVGDHVHDDGPCCSAPAT